MGSIAAIRQGLASNLSSIPGFQVSAYIINPTLPTIWVRPSPETSIDYHRTMHNGETDWHMQVQAFVGDTTDIGAQKKLDELLENTGESSVFAAIESDRTLGGACDDLKVEGCSGYHEYARPDGSTALGAEWSVLVLTGS